MPPPDAAKIVRVFLASPGDVGDERAFVRTFLETVLPKDHFLDRPVQFQVVAWDDPAAGVPMPAHLTPQEAVIAFKTRPAACDIVIVILWGRLGTHLDVAKLSRPDGTAYRSGTEWEFEDAFNANPRPHILVYHRADDPKIPPRGPARDDAIKQIDAVDSFLARFKNPDGSWAGGFKPYRGIRGFRSAIANDLKAILAPVLAAKARPAEATRAAIPLPDRCFGRDADRETIVAALQPGAAVLVQGTGGIGKTTLTQAAATDDRIVARFGPHRWFVALDAANDRDTFDGAVIQALGLDPAQGFAGVLARLGQEPALLVLDNLESPWDKDPVAIEQRLASLAAVPGLALLASFRGDETVHGAAWAPRHTVRPLSEADSRALFFDIAQTIPDSDPHLPDLLSELGGVPLAICLIARRAARHTGLAELWAEWQTAGAAVARLPGAAQGRLTSVPRSIAFSLRSSRLTDPGQRLFRLLGCLPAGIAAADRQALLGGDSLTAFEQVLGVGLAIQRDGRLDLLPPVRRYARDT